jgi:hypothetical protein
VKQKQKEQDDCKETLRNATATAAQYITEHGAQGKKDKADIAAFDKLMRNVDYTELRAIEEALKGGNKAMAPDMANRLAGFDAKQALLKPFDPRTASGQAAEKRVRKYEEDTKKASALVAKLTKEVEANEKWLTAERAKMQKRPIQRAYEDSCLAANGIEKQRSYTVQLVGKGVELLAEKNATIMDTLQQLLLEKKSEDPSIEKSEAEIRTFIAHQKELLDLLYWLGNVAKSNAVQSEETIAKFDVLAKKFGVLYRLYYNKHACPKVHMLESEVPLMLALYKRLGLFSEEAMEREHQIVHKYMKQLCAIPDFHTKVKLMTQRRHMIKLPSVAAAIDFYETGKKRKFSGVTIASKLVKVMHDKKVKEEKLNDVAQKYNTTV